MTEIPTHRHITSGHIVFWQDHLDPAEYELLPDDHWGSPEMRAHKLQGEINGIKMKAERDILAVAPLWRQVNDLAALIDPANPDHSAARRRRAEIDDIRRLSNEREQALKRDST
jgi:hypothetical protein